MGIDRIALDVLHQTATSAEMSLICCCNFPAQVLSVLNRAFCEGGRFGALQTLDHGRFSSVIHSMVADGLADEGANAVLISRSIALPLTSFKACFA